MGEVADLRPVPDDGGAAVAQLPLALARVVVAQEEVILGSRWGHMIGGKERQLKMACFCVTLRALLTSRDVRQYQQKTCLQRLHII